VKLADPNSAMVVFRNKVVVPLRRRFPPDEREVMDAGKAVRAFKKYGYEGFYLVLDGSTCTAERQEHEPALLRETRELDVGVSLIINRLTDQTLHRVYNTYGEAIGRHRIINGLDVNAPYMATTTKNLINFWPATEHLLRRCILVHPTF
jgi:hypothetical protein